MLKTPILSFTCDSTTPDKSAVTPSYADTPSEISFRNRYKSLNDAIIRWPLWKVEEQATIHSSLGSTSKTEGFVDLLRFVS